MKNKRSFLAFLLALGVGMLLCGAALAPALAQDQPANVAGSWTLAATTQRGTFNQSMTIQQDGSTIKGTISGRRGDTPITGTVKGNAISFTVSRDTPRGTFTMTYNGTVDGDSMKGTAGNQRFTFDWTAKRGASAGGSQ